MPSVLSSALDGPSTCTQLSAVTCGGIISGIRKQKTSARLPRMSVRATSRAKAPPSSTETTVPPTAVSRLCQVARQVDRAPSTSCRTPVPNCPPGAMLSRTSRPIGTTLSPETSTTRATKTTRSPLTWIRRGSGEPGFTPCPSAKGGYSPKTSANFFLFCSAFASAISASSGMSFIASGDGNPAGGATSGCAGM